MHPEDRKRFIERYEKRYEKYGYDPRTLGWYKGRQAIRFHILTSIGELNGKSILDLGCGFADLYKFLKDRGWHGKYTGFDIVPKLIEVARKMYPQLDLRVMDILETSINEKFDYVLASGLFNAKIEMEDNEEYVKNMLRKMFELAKIGVAVDFMTSYVDYKQEGAYHADPEKIFKFCRNLSKRIVLRCDYMPYEFAVYIYKDDSVIKDKNVFSGFMQILRGSKDGNF